MDATETQKYILPRFSPEHSRILPNNSIFSISVQFIKKIVSKALVEMCFNNLKGTTVGQELGRFWTKIIRKEILIGILLYERF